MTADARMIFVGCSARDGHSVSVPKWELALWWRHLPASKTITQRTADVGASILSTVAVVSQHEAAVATAAARVEAARPGMQDAAMLRFCDLLEPLIGTVSSSYYSSWVIIETADID